MSPVRRKKNNKASEDASRAARILPIREQRVLAAIHNLTVDGGGCPPSLRELGEALSLRSPLTTSRLRSLVTAGLLAIIGRRGYIVTPAGYEALHQSLRARVAAMDAAAASRDFATEWRALRARQLDTEATAQRLRARVQQFTPRNLYFPNGQTKPSTHETGKTGEVR